MDCYFNHLRLDKITERTFSPTLRFPSLLTLDPRLVLNL